MTRNHAILAVLAAVFVGWGCGRAPTANPAALSAGQGRSLEARLTRLEQDLKAAQAQAADLQGKIQAEAARSAAVEKERDDLRATLVARTADLASRTTELATRTDELKARTGERDAVQGKLDGFHRSLRELVGQMEAAVTPTPATAAGLPFPAPAIEPTPLPALALPAPVLPPAAP